MLTIEELYSYLYETIKSLDKEIKNKEHTSYRRNYITGSRDILVILKAKIYEE